MGRETWFLPPSGQIQNWNFHIQLWVDRGTVILSLNIHHDAVCNLLYFLHSPLIVFHVLLRLDLLRSFLYHTPSQVAELHSPSICPEGLVDVACIPLLYFLLYIKLNYFLVEQFAKLISKVSRYCLCQHISDWASISLLLVDPAKGIKEVHHDFLNNRDIAIATIFFVSPSVGVLLGG